MKQEPVKQTFLCDMKIFGESERRGEFMIERWVNPTTEPLRQAGECLCLHCAKAPACVTFQRLYFAAMGAVWKKKGSIIHDAVMVGIMVTECKGWTQKDEDVEKKDEGKEN